VGQWFMSYHPKLQIVIAEQIEAAHIQDTFPPVLEKWFHNIQSVIEQFNVQPGDICKMDEMGFSIDGIKATRVIIDRTQKIQYQLYPPC
jgi:hypothetical protein